METRGTERQRDEAAREKQRERREKAIVGAQAALGEAEREHDKNAAVIQAEPGALNRPRSLGNDASLQPWFALSPIGSPGTPLELVSVRFRVDDTIQRGACTFGLIAKEELRCEIGGLGKDRSRFSWYAKGAMLKMLQKLKHAQPRRTQAIFIVQASPAAAGHRAVLHTSVWLSDSSLQELSRRMNQSG